MLAQRLAMSIMLLLVSVENAFSQSPVNDAKKRLLAEAGPAFAKWKSFYARTWVVAKSEGQGYSTSGKAGARSQAVHEFARFDGSQFMTSLSGPKPANAKAPFDVRILVATPEKAFEVRRATIDGPYVLTKLASNEVERRTLSDKISTIADNMFGRAMGFNGIPFIDWLTDKNVLVKSYQKDQAGSAKENLSLNRLDYEYVREFDGKEYVVEGSVWLDVASSWCVTKFSFLPYPKTPALGRWDGSFKYEGELSGLPKLTSGEIIMSGQSGKLVTKVSFDWSNHDQITSTHFAMKHYAVEGADIAVTPPAAPFSFPWKWIAVLGVALIVIGSIFRIRLGRREEPG